MSNDVSSFLKDKPHWNNLINNVFGGESTTVLKINNSTVETLPDSEKEPGAIFSAVKTFNDGIRNSVSSAADPIERAARTGSNFINPDIRASVLKIQNYQPPTGFSLKGLDDIGKDFDKIIKDTFIGQIFRIKGTEILCSAFCLLVSFLPCSTRNSLYNAIQDIENATNDAAMFALHASDTIQSINATMASLEAVAGSVDSIFESPVEGVFSKNGLLHSTQTAYATISGAVSSINNTIEQLSRLLKLSKVARVALPYSPDKIWHLATAILFGLQGMAMSAADKILSQITNPIEKTIQSMIPSNCLTYMASAFYNKIIETIREWKQYVIMLVAELFNANISFADAYNQYNSHSRAMLETIAFLDALKLITSHFGDLARACGIDQCKKDPPFGQVLRSGGRLDDDSVPYDIIYGPPPEIGKKDDLSDKLEALLETPVFVTPDTIESRYTIAPPTKIRLLFDDPEVKKHFGNDYSIYKNNDEITVVYKFERKCGYKEE